MLAQRGRDFVTHAVECRELVREAYRNHAVGFHGREFFLAHPPGDLWE